MDQSFSKIWIIVILVIFLAGGIFAWQYFRAPGEEVENETADWETYRSEKFGYEIKYPQNIYLDKYPENLCIKEGYEWVEFMDCEAMEKPDLYAPRVIIDILIHTTELSLHDWLKKVGTEEESKSPSPFPEKCDPFCFFTSVSELKDIYINNIPALQFNSWLVSTDGIVILIKKPPNIIIEIVNFHTGIGVKGFSDKIFNQMLSTFRFLE